MNLAETHDLLVYCATLDNRRFDDATVAAWHQLLREHAATDARAAAAIHYRDRPDVYLMPGHIHQGAAERARVRQRAEREAAEAEAKAIEAASARPTRDRSAEISAFVAQVRSILPEGDPAKLRPRAAEWARRQRVERAEPNPHYRPTAPADQESA